MTALKSTFHSRKAIERSAPALGCRLALILCVGVSFGLVAGEKVIFEDEVGEIELPSAILKRERLNNTIQYPDPKKKSSVDGVLGVYIFNTPNASPKAKRNLLEALEKQKNWMLQTPDEFLESADLAKTIELDVDNLDSESLDLDKRSKRTKSSAERFFLRNEGKTAKAPNWSQDRDALSLFDRKIGESDRDESALLGSHMLKPDEYLDQSDEEEFEGMEVFNTRFENLFEARRTDETDSTSPLGVFDSTVGLLQLETVGSPFGEEQDKKLSPSQLRAQEFRKLLDATASYDPFEKSSGSDQGSSLGILGGESDSTRDPLNPIFPERPNGTSSGDFMSNLNGSTGTYQPIGEINQPLVNTEFSTEFRNPLSQPGRVGGFGVIGGAARSPNPATSGPSVHRLNDRPAVFRLPQRSF